MGNQPTNRLKELRSAAGKSLSDLEAASGVARNSINLIERGDAELTYDKMRALGRALGVPPSALMLEEDVELRLGDDMEPLLAVLRAIPAERRLDTATAANAVVRLSMAMTAKSGSVDFQGDEIQLMRLSSLWNGMPDEQRGRALDMLAATGFSEPPRNFGRGL